MPVTPHDHGVAGAPPTVVGGYASLSLASLACEGQPR